MNTFNEITEVKLFSAPVYKVESFEFLEIARNVSQKFINKRKHEIEFNPAFPVCMTESLHADPEMYDFSNMILATAWNILSSQGYQMDVFTTYIMDMWCQEHFSMSSMERHIHGNGSIFSGFYFLDCPENSSRVIYHDPRDSKVITSLPQKDENLATHASNNINFVPTDGMLMFANSWLPHSFTKNLSETPLRFIHFNIAVTTKQNIEPSVEVI